MKLFAISGQTGECISCARLSSCSKTSVKLVMGDFSCLLYVPVVEPIYDARVAMVRKYGYQQAVGAMVGNQNKEE